MQMSRLQRQVCWHQSEEEDILTCPERAAAQMIASELAGIEPSQQLAAPPGGGADRAPAARSGEEVRFTWRLENFTAFRSILETRKVFSR